MMSAALGMNLTGRLGVGNEYSGEPHQKWL